MVKNKEKNIYIQMNKNISPSDSYVIGLGNSTRVQIPAYNAKIHSQKSRLDCMLNASLNLILQNHPWFKVLRHSIHSCARGNPELRVFSRMNREFWQFSYSVAHVGSVFSSICEHKSTNNHETLHLSLEIIYAPTINGSIQSMHKNLYFLLEN